MRNPTHRLTVKGKGFNYSLVFWNEAVASDIFRKTHADLYPKGFSVVLEVL